MQPTSGRCQLFLRDFGVDICIRGGAFLGRDLLDLHMSCVYNELMDTVPKITDYTSEIVWLLDVLQYHKESHQWWVDLYTNNPGSPSLERNSAAIVSKEEQEEDVRRYERMISIVSNITRRLDSHST
jgi:hypothetical protein